MPARARILLVLAVSLGVTSQARPGAVPGMENLPENHGHVDAKLFLGEGAKQPLIVGFGGSEGGNMFAKQALKPAVDQYLAAGYAFLAIGYFGAPGTPKELDRISVNAVHDAIADAARNPKVNGACIGVVGGSKGAELALVLASHYPDIKAVAALAPGFAVFAGHTSTLATSSFSLDGKPLPFVPVPESAVQFLLPPNRNLRLAWDEMIKDKAAVEKAAIAVERINGPILLVSAKRDEFWPSTPMSEQMIERLQRSHFPYKFEHIAVDGVHGAAYTHPELADDFFRANLLAGNAAGCPRKQR